MNKEETKEYYKEYYQNNKEKIKEQTGKYQKENREQSTHLQKKWRDDNKDRSNLFSKKYYNNHREKEIIRTKIKNSSPEYKIKNRETQWRRHGIKDMTQERYNFMIEKQNGNCAICGENEKEFKKKLGVDHNHTTGEVRGLLCNKCNQGIGLLSEDIDILASAISYLKKDDIDNS